VIDATRTNNRMTLTLALSYSARDEIIRAIRTLAQKAAEGQIKPQDITEQTISDHLDTHNMPDPDLLIRTSGEYRISNYLLWQIAYSELYFSNKFWPEFRREDLMEALADYQKRERRFGKTGEQVKA
jgi:undecaprenyl diphosphate synthase